MHAHAQEDCCAQVNNSNTSQRCDSVPEPARQTSLLLQRDQGRACEHRCESMEHALACGSLLAAAAQQSLCGSTAPVAGESDASALELGCERQASAGSELEPMTCGLGPVPHRCSSLIARYRQAMVLMQAFLHADESQVSASLPEVQVRMAVLKGNCKSRTDNGMRMLGRWLLQNWS